MATATKTAISLIARGTSNAAFTQLTGCSVTRSGTTATLTKTSHGLSNGDIVLIQGFSLEEFNGVFTVANAATNTFDYTIIQDPGANPTGTPGTVDKGTRSSLWTLTTDGGGVIKGHIQNTTTGPTVGPQIWRGLAAAGSAEGNFLWDRVLTGSVTANDLTPFDVDVHPGILYARIAIFRNTGQAVDITAEGHELTSW